MFAQDDNPYAAPEAPLAAADPWASDPFIARIGAPGWRFVAFAVDVALAIVAGYALLVVLAVSTGNGMPRPLGEYLVPRRVANSVVSTGFLGWLVYSALLESSPWQATLGKRWCGLYVVSRDCDRISFGRGLWRAFLKMLGCMLYYVGGAIPLLFTRGRFTFQDLIAKTVVLRGTPERPVDRISG